jgi:cobalt-zinc-cadmium efflux system outer membrane protein
VAQTFEYPGRIALRKAIANRQVELAELGLAQFQSSLAARARAQAQLALAAQQKADATHEVTQRFRSLLDVLVQRDPAGVTPLLDQRIIEANAITLERRAAQAGRELQGALLELNQLRGAPAATPLRLTGSLDVPTNAPALSVLLDVAATNNFELRTRQAELAQQGFQVQLAKNERYPSVTLAPFYASEKANDEQRIVGIGVSLPLPLWNQNKGDIEAAQAREQQAEASLRVTQRDVERRLTDHAMALESQLAGMAQWRPDAQARFREAAEVADRHFRLGAVPVTTYVEMQLKYLDALESLLATRHEALEHRQQLEVLVGQPLEALTAR